MSPRINIVLTESEIKALAAISRETGLCRSDLIRRAVDLLYSKRGLDEEDK